MRLESTLHPGSPIVQHLEVGGPYHPSRRRWSEGADYNYRDGAHELGIFPDRPTPTEVAAVESGPVESGMFAEPEGLLIVARFGRTLSLDCSYQWHRVDPAERLPPPAEETSPALRALVSIILMDASTGVVHARRAVTYSPEFTRALHRAIAGQAGAPFDALAHERWAAGLLRRTAAELWGRCAIRCRDGD
jgi:hypothetical protein